MTYLMAGWFAHIRTMFVLCIVFSAKLSQEAIFIMHFPITPTPTTVSHDEIKNLLFE